MFQLNRDSGPQILPSATRVTLENDATLFLVGTHAIGSLSSVGPATIRAYNNFNYWFSVGLNNESTTFAGTIEHVNLEKVGTGTLTLTGTSTFTGTAAISAGKLVVDGALSVNSRTLIEAGAALGGNGRLGTVDAKSGAVLSPGHHNPGTLTITNGTLLGGGSYVWKLNNASDDSSAQGVTYDWLVVNNILTIASDSATPFEISLLSLNPSDEPGLLSNFNPAQSCTWTLATAQNGIVRFNADKFVLNAEGFLNTHPRVGAFCAHQRWPELTADIHGGAGAGHDGARGCLWISMARILPPQIGGA